MSKTNDASEWWKEVRRQARKSKSDGVRYGAGRPRQIPAGRVLAHNHVEHGANWPNGGNGFRWWTCPKEKKPRHFLRCECGWMNLPHFAHRDHAKRFKCSTFKPSQSM